MNRRALRAREEKKRMEKAFTVVVFLAFRARRARLFSKFLSFYAYFLCMFSFDTFEGPALLRHKEPRFKLLNR
mgnify:CR=1 FL=1